MGINASWRTVERLRILNFLLLLAAYIVIMVMSIVSLRKRNLSNLIKIIWALVILCFPVSVSIAFYVVNIGSKKEAVEI
jgi:hypothetical protein